MRITEITFSMGQTLQLKQYEPTNIHYSAKATVNFWENKERAYEQLEDIVKTKLREEILRVTKKQKELNNKEQENGN